MEKSKDTKARKYQITINNPFEKGLSHDKIKESLLGLKSTKYYCMSDEVGIEEKTPHTHIYIVFSSPVRFTTLKNVFPTAHIEKALGTSQENKDYITKTGKWEKSNKKETSIDGSFEEWGEMPVEKGQGHRTDLEELYNLIKDGATNYDILESNPDNIKHINSLDKIRQTIIKEEGKNTFREVKVTYIFGETGTGKTRYVMERYGYDKVFRVTDYKHPFDSYNGEDVICFDEFNSPFKIQDMLNFLDGYPLELPCRYNNKWAVYHTVFIISNLSLDMQYMNVQCERPKVWNAFLRRIDEVKEFLYDGSVFDYSVDGFKCLKEQSSLAKNRQINLNEELEYIAELDEKFEKFKKENMEKNGQNT